MARQNRKVALLLWGLVGVAALAAGWLLFASPRLDEGPTVELGRGNYRLATTDGEAFSEDSLVGSPSAVVFGFTHCPDVCPTTLGDIATWREALGPEAAELQVFSVMVDPERDTAEVLGDYVSWVPGVTGVTGPREEVDRAVEAFRLYAERVPLEGDGYTMDHSSMVLLFDRRGRLFGPIGYGEGTDRAGAKIRRLLEA